ncbi:MAG: DoxX family protein [Myxococcaceae bacterium]|nr:DoxX family protein [Myxococcaceae bacterium]
MAGAGVLHFVTPEPFVRIVPPWLPSPLLLVWVSGVAEIALAALLLVPRARRLASYGLVALLVAVFPANVHMALAQVQMDPEHPAPAWFPWARLPFQALFIAVALWVGRR